DLGNRATGAFDRAVPVVAEYHLDAVVHAHTDGVEARRERRGERTEVVDVLGAQVAIAHGRDAGFADVCEQVDLPAIVGLDEAATIGRGRSVVADQRARPRRDRGARTLRRIVRVVRDGSHEGAG